jgi:hypothetical protein
MKNLVRITLILAVSSCCNAGKKSPPSGETTAASSTPASGPVVPVAVKRDFKDRPVAQIKVKEILDEYKNNEVRADGTYKDKIIQIRGKVEDVKKDITDSIYVTVGTGAQFEIPVVQCFVKDGEEKAASALNKGDNVTVMGHVDGLMMNVLVKDCVINPDMKLCEKFRAAFGSEAKCKADESGASLDMPHEFSMSPLCVASKEKYDSIASKIRAETDKKLLRLLSDQSQCVLLIASAKPLSPELTAKAQKALDSL